MDIESEAQKPVREKNTEKVQCSYNISAISEYQHPGLARTREEMTSGDHR